MYRIIFSWDLVVILFYSLIILIAFTFICVYVCVPVCLNMYHMFRSEDNVRSATKNADHQHSCLLWVRGTNTRSPTRKRVLNQMSHLSSADVGILKTWTNSLSSTKRSVPIFQMLASKLKFQQFIFTIW